MINLNNSGYVGYGPNADPDVVEAVTGEVPLWTSKAAIMQDVQLCVQTLADIPNVPIAEGAPSVQDILRSNWGDDFEAYALRPHESDIVVGRYFDLSPRALSRMMKWDLTEEGWFKPGRVKAVVVPGSRVVEASTVYLGEGQSFTRTADGIQHPKFLTSKKLVLEIANSLRETFEHES